MNTPISRAHAAITSVTRDPNKSRAHTSRPAESVPRKCSTLGGPLMLSRSTRFWSWNESHGANIDPMANTNRIPMPSIDSLCLRKRSHRPRPDRRESSSKSSARPTLRSGASSEDSFGLRNAATEPSRMAGYFHQQCRRLNQRFVRLPCLIPAASHLLTALTVANPGIRVCI